VSVLRAANQQRITVIEAGFEFGDRDGHTGVADVGIEVPKSTQAVIDGDVDTWWCQKNGGAYECRIRRRGSEASRDCQDSHAAPPIYSPV
jgi:hypothetical protein